MFLKSSLRLALITILSLLFSVNVQPSQASTTNNICAATVEQLAGQGRYAIAGTGRYAIAGTGRYAIAGTNGLTQQQEQHILDNLVGPEWILQALPSIDDGSDNMTESVAVLIVDDFSYADTSHGYQVKEVIDDQAALLAQEGIQVDTYAIDVSDGTVNYRVDSIATEIDNTINNLTNNYSRFVINMSFAAIPCQDTSTGFDFDTFVSNFETNQSEEDGEAEYNLEQYISEEVEYEEDGGEEEEGEEDGDSSSTTSEDYLEDLLSNPTYNTGMADLQNLLAGYLQEDPNNRIIVPVASAGNFADRTPNEPYAPARWDETISVAAGIGYGDDMWSSETLDLWQYSQPGDVVMPGAWYHFDDGNFRAGTSFAAPFASMVSALYLTYPYDAEFPCTLSEEAAPTDSVGTWGNEGFFAGPLACTVDDVPFTSTADAQLSISKSADVGTAAEGDTVTLTVTVTNNGNDPATRVKLLDEVASVGGLSYTDATMTKGVYNAGNGTWWIGTLDPNETVTLTLTADVLTGTSGTDITLSAVQLSSDELPEGLTDSVTIGIQ